MSCRVFTWLLAVVITCCLCRAAWGSVVAIDFGSELIKVAIVKPGVPMEIVLNSESKRKTPAIVSLRNGERLFGDAALSTAVKYPRSAYWYQQLLLGQKFDSPSAREYMARFPYYDYVRDEDRGTVLFQHDSNTVYSPEELVAMMLNNSRQSAETYAGHSIRDVVITVPTFFNQAQRRAMLYSAELVGLNVLQLMSNGAAAALNYGVFRQAMFNATPTYIMLFDMGASSTVATIIEYRKVQVKERGVANTHPQLTVKGAGFDRTLGGLEMDLRLRKYLADQFDALKKTSGSVYDSPRAMAKLLKEAKRVKQVLSANTEHYAQVEGLLEDVDFRARVTREQLEELCSDLLERVEGTVEQALHAADITMGEVESVFLVGGGTRVPAVQDALMDAIDRVELGRSLNTDEAIAMGAVYQGAGHSKLFKVQKFIVKESTVYPIQVSFSRPVSGEGGEGVKTVTRTLFQRSNSFPQKKLLTFNRYSSDFAFQVFYSSLAFLPEREQSYVGRLNLTEVYLPGVAAALSRHSEAEPRGVKAHFNMDGSGLLKLELVQSLFEYPSPPEEQSTLSKLGSTLSSFFGVGGDTPPESTNEDAGFEEVEQNENESTGIESEQPDSGVESEQPDSGVESEQPASEDEDSELESDSTGVELESEDDDMESESNGDEQSEESIDSGIESEPEEESETVNADAGMESEQEEDDSEPDAGTEPGLETGMESDQDTGTEPDQEPPPQQTEDTADNSSSSSAAAAAAAAEGGEEGEGTNTSNTTASSNSSSSGSSDRARKGKKEPTENVAKVNITAETTVLDLAPPTSADTDVSTDKLAVLQLIDQDKRDNEQAKNNFESHVFQTLDVMYSEPVVAVTTEEQREEVLAALTEASDWLDDEGYMAETKVYRDKLRSLRRVSRAVFRRVEEAEKRPVLAARLRSSLNISHDFLFRMHNLSGEVQIFTEVEMTSLETLINETETWLNVTEEEQETTPAHEEPVLLTYELEEHMRRLDREIMYLLNKLRSHRPPPPPSSSSSSTTTPRNKNSSSNSNSSSSSSSSAEANNTTLPDDHTAADEATPTNGEATPTPPDDEAPPTEPVTEEPTETETPEEAAGDEEHQEL